MDQNNETLDYRLSNIEKTLTELKDVMVENKLQARDIAELKKSVEENTKGLNSHDKRIRDLEVKPLQEKSDKWERYVKMVMDLVFTGAIVIVLAKLGLK